MSSAGERLVRLEEASVRIEKKLDVVLDDHEKRLRGAERWQWFHSGALTLLIGAVGIAVKVLPH